MNSFAHLACGLSLALGLASGAACSGDFSAEPECQADLDTDGDGLFDCEELALGTAMHLSDSDGDGISDYDEVVEYGFSPENNNYKFNPLIADTPKVRVEITSPPSIALLYTEGTTTGVAAETAHGTSTTVGSTQSVSSTNSQAVEYTETVGGSVTVGAEAGFPGGVSGSVEATVSYESSVATTSETSHTWSQEQTQENGRTLSQALTREATESIEISGGVLATTVDVVNEGDVAFTLSNVALSAYMITPGRDSILSPVGGLNVDTTQTSFPQFTYAPGQQNGPFVFVNDGLDTATATSLLADSSSLSLQVVAYELTDENGRSFTHNQTEIAARTATILIDYNDMSGDFDANTIERYQVATNIDAERLRIGADEALREILNVPFEVDAKGSLESVRGLASNADTNGHWVVVHKSTNGIADTIEQKSASREDYQLSDIELRSGDILHLVYVEDADGDGLGSRLEAVSGADPSNPDTDEDGLQDGDEVNIHKSSPLLADTDGDRLGDYDEVVTWNSDPTTDDTDGDGIADDIDMFRLVGNNWGDVMVAVTASGELWRWGQSVNGTRVVSDEVEIKSLFVGAYGYMAQDVEGDYFASGSNLFAQLGTTAVQATNNLVETLGGYDFETISTTMYHSLAIGPEGQLVGWGWGREGRLGVDVSGTCFSVQECQSSPLVLAEGEWKAVSAGLETSFAIREDGTLWAWGSNRNHLLGLGDDSVVGIVLEPTQVGTDSDWVSVSGGEYHNLALKEDGTLWAWGDGNLLGAGQGAAHASQPVQVGADDTWTKFAVGHRHSLAIQEDGSLWAWGDGGSGALGLGDTEDRYQPTRLGTETHWTSVYASVNGSAAQSSDHSLWTWGANYAGKLGHDSVVSGDYAIVPAQVRLSR